MIVGLDIDGVFADFNGPFIDRVVAVTGRDLFPPRPFDIPTWNYPELYGYTDAEVSAVWEVIKTDPKFWQRLPAYEDAYAALSLLHTKTTERGDDVYFVTSRPGVAAKTQTERWLRCHGFPTPTVLLSSAKGAVARALKFDVYVDDRWENAVDVAGEWKIETTLDDGPQSALELPVGKRLVNTSHWVQSSTRTFLVDRPWNQKPNAGDYTASDDYRYGLTRVDSALAFVRAL